MFNNLIWESGWSNKASLSISTQDNGTTSLIKPNPGLTQQEVYYVNTFMHELEQYFLLYGNMHISDCKKESFHSNMEEKRVLSQVILTNLK